MLKDVRLIYEGHERSVACSTTPIDDLRIARAMIDGEIAARACTGIQIANGGRYERDMPAGGATFEVDWCTSDGLDITWFATVDAAKAALLAFAEGESRRPSESGMYVDLTKQGCHESCAYVKERLNL